MNRPEIQEMMEKIDSDLLLLKNKSVYELTQKKGILSVLRCQLELIKISKM